ncbi:MAG: carotenoid oxygenase family protein [Acidimicrobiales bacterium]
MTPPPPPAAPPPPPPVDPATVPALSGVFAAVTDERDAADLAVEGDLPEGLAGAYLRNGPNPLYPPLGSYTYPLDGDGMIHGLWFEDGRVRYRNRIVWTPQLRAERAAGKALWAGLRTPYLPGPDLVPAELADDYKPLPDINIVRHGGRYLALAEVDPPVEVTPDLDTVGSYDFGGVIPGMCAHPRIDPATGEMVLFRYDIEEPYLTWSSVAPDGSVSVAPQVIPLDGAFMIHDFTITPSSLVLFVGPLQFDFDAMFSGGDMLAWKPELGLRIAIVDRTGSGAVRWIETEPFWVWHFANAFERVSDAGATEIVVDFTRWSRPGFGAGPPITGAISRAVIDAGAGTVEIEDLSDESAEFSRIDDRLIGRPHRHFVATTKTGDLPVGEQNTLVRVDTATGSLERWVSGPSVFDEVIFVPAPGGEPEQGYYVTFRTDRTTLTSDFVVLDADDIAAGPIARIPLPFRVPTGLHGNWFPST